MSVLDRLGCALCDLAGETLRTGVLLRNGATAFANRTLDG